LLAICAVEHGAPIASKLAPTRVFHWTGSHRIKGAVVGCCWRNHRLPCPTAEGRADRVTRRLRATADDSAPPAATYAKCRISWRFAGCRRQGPQAMARVALPCCRSPFHAACSQAARCTLLLAAVRRLLAALGRRFAPVPRARAPSGSTGSPGARRAHRV